jgi:hypothetical protein
VRNPSPRKTLQQELSVQAGQRASATWRIFAVARALLVVANFHEKAHFVKPTWRLPRGRVQRLCPSRYASIRCEYAIGGCGRRFGSV